MFNQPNYDKEKPEFLFRGVKISYELLKDFKLEGVDLNPPHPPVINEQGKKTVGDGNEYGVYMTDHEQVARNAYAAVKENDGTPLNKDVVFGYDKNRTKIPAVGIVYKIKTEGLDAHVPWITSHLMGHYNNGMGGDEWIAESVPASNYVVDTIEIGQDTLHEAEMIQFENVEEAKRDVLNKINQRKERLELFENEIEKIPERKRYLLDSSKIDILKSIYKIGGIMDIDLEKFEPKTPSECIDYLKAVTYSTDKENIDFGTLGYLQTLSDKSSKINTVDDLIAVINSDISKNEEQKNKFVEKKEKDNEEYTTSFFDRKESMYQGVLENLNSRINNKEEKTKVDFLNEYNEKLSILQKQYGDVSKRIETLMMQNSNEPVENYQEKLNVLLQQRNDLSSKMEPVIQTQRTFQRAVDFEKEEKHKTVISQVEKMFSTRITGTMDTGRFVRTEHGMFPQMDLKDKATLRQEQGNMVKKLDELYYDGELDIKTWQSMKSEIGKEYEKLVSEAPIPSKEEKKFTEQEIGKATVNTPTFEKQEAQEKVEMDMGRENRQQNKSEIEINEFGEIIRPNNTKGQDFRENLKFETTKTTDEYVAQVLDDFEKGIDRNPVKKKVIPDHKVEKGDDDWVM